MAFIQQSWPNLITEYKINKEIKTERIMKEKTQKKNKEIDR